MTPKNTEHLTFQYRIADGYAVYRCSCGALCEKRVDKVNSGNTLSCGHLRASNRNRNLRIIAPGTLGT